MTKSLVGIELDNGGVVVKFLQTAVETDGALHQQEARYKPHSGIYAMNRATRGRPRPRLQDAAAILMEYRDEFELAKPPALVQRIVFGCLAPFGRAALRPAGLQR